MVVAATVEQELRGQEVRRTADCVGLGLVVVFTIGQLLHHGKAPRKSEIANLDVTVGSNEKVLGLADVMGSVAMVRVVWTGVSVG